MRHHRKLAVALLAAVLFVTPALAGGNANFLLGLRKPTEDRYDHRTVDALQDIPAFGVSVDFRTGNLPINWVVGAYRASKDADQTISGQNVTVTSTFSELSFGVNKIWSSTNMRPHVGGGVTYMKGEIELKHNGQSGSQDDKSPAVYAEGGVYWRLGHAFNVGVSGRVVRGTSLKLKGEDFQGDYAQVGLVLGWGWGD